jgi:hypothetical protein
MSLFSEMTEIGKLGVDQLAAKFREVTGKKTKRRDRDWLLRQISASIQARIAIEEREVAKAKQKPRKSPKARAGKADPVVLVVPQLVETAPVAGKKRGGDQASEHSRPRRPGEPPVGTTLTRRWHEKDHVVKVLATGYEYEGTIYRSLSAVAESITGAHWSGQLFFNLRGRSKKA